MAEADKKICRCALNFLSVLDGIDDINALARIYQIEKKQETKELSSVKETLILQTKRVESALKRANESCK
ncbi:unnamed protein product, partial [marine sediment metagenome]